MYFLSLQLFCQPNTDEKMFSAVPWSVHVNCVPPYPTSLLLVSCFELPITRTCSDFPSRFELSGVEECRLPYQAIWRCTVHWWLMLTNGLDVNKRAFYRLKRELQNAAPCWDNPISCHPLSVTEVNIEDVIFIIRPAPHDLGSIPPIFANGKKVTDYILWVFSYLQSFPSEGTTPNVAHERASLSSKSESESECECASGVAAVSYTHLTLPTSDLV